MRVLFGNFSLYLDGFRFKEDQKRIAHHSRGIYGIYLKNNKDHNLKLTGLGNTRILIGYAPKPPRLMIRELANVGQCSWELFDLARWTEYI